MSEHSEQALVVRQLRELGVLCASIPNEATRGGWQYGQRGMLKGAPDLLILSPPSVDTLGFVGVALEFKKTRGGQLRPQQADVLGRLRTLGWWAHEVHGAEHALQVLRTLGYAVGVLGPPLEV